MNFAELLGTIIIPGLFTAVVLPVIGFIGKAVYDLIRERDRDGKIRRSVETAVRFAEQVGKELGGEEKFNIALKQASAALYRYGITIPPEILGAMVEATVQELFNQWRGVEELTVPVCEHCLGVAGTD